MTEEQCEPRRYRVGQYAITLLALAFIAIFHGLALHDRFLLILYSISVAGTAYALIQRRAFVAAVVVVTAAGTAFLSNIYFEAKTESLHPLLDPIRDMAALGALAWVLAKLVFEAYRVQKQDREREMRRLFDHKMVAMRAAALRSTSHEVRTPLSTIISINETLLNETAGPLTEVQRDFLRDTDDAARHLMNLVNDILDYAKAEAGMIKLSPERVALAELVDQCVTMLQPNAEAAGVGINVEVAREVSEIIADPLRLKQILLNLLSNAVKYNEQNGRVAVRVRGSGDEVVISVRDTGRGIPADQIEHLFNPYYQAAREDQGIGTGLGLAIVRHLTELHGGTVVVESVPQTGTVFTVRLPRQAVVPVGDVDGPLATRLEPLSSDLDAANPLEVSA